MIEKAAYLKNIAGQHFAVREYTLFE
jgi:hypothetical protein